MVVALWFFQRPGVASLSTCLGSRNPHRIPDRKEGAMRLFVIRGYQWAGRFAWAGPETSRVVTQLELRRKPVIGLRLARREQPC